MLKPTNQNGLKWICLSHFVIDLYSGFLNPILPFIAANLNINLAIAASIVSLAQITSSITQPIFGFIADRFKKRFFIFFGMIIASIFLSCTTIAPNIFVLALCVILGSLGVSFFHPQAGGLTNYFTKQLQDNITKKMSIYLTCGTLGFAIGPIISSSIVNFIGLQALPITSTLGLIFAFSLFLFVPKISNLQDSQIENKKSFISTINDILSFQPTRILVSLSIIKALLQVTFVVLLPFLWKSQGYSPFHIGIIIFFFLISGALGTILSNKFEKTITTKHTIRLSLTTPLFFTLGFFFSYQSLPLFSQILFIISGFFIMLSTPINMTLAQKFMPQYKSTLSGLIGGFSFGTIGLFLPIIGYISEKITIPYMLCLLAIIPAIFSYIVKFLPDIINKHHSNSIDFQQKNNLLKI